MIQIPFNYNPTSTVHISSGTYTAVSGKYARVIATSTSISSNAITINGISSPFTGTISFWIKSGDSITSLNSTRLYIEEYSVIQ